MPFPTGWPPRPSSGSRSIRFFQSGTTTAVFDDNAFLFSQDPGANTYLPTPFVAPGGEDTIVAVGTLQVGGSPMGGGQNAHDVNTSAPPAQQAVPEAMIWSNTIRVINDGANDLEISFDGTLVQGVVQGGETLTYFTRYEAGIAVRGAMATTFRIEAW